MLLINKIDLPTAEPERVSRAIEDVIGIDASGALRISAKTGEGVEDLLEQIVQQVPPPAGDPGAPLEALIIDSWFDAYVGVVSLVRVVNGSIERGSRAIQRTDDVCKAFPQIGADHLRAGLPRKKRDPLNVHVLKERSASRIRRST